MIYADNFTTTKLNEFISDSLMMPENCIISMLTFECAKPSQAGIVKVNKRNVMIDFNEKPTNSESKLANAGIFYMTSKFINNIKLIKRPVNDFSIDIIPKLKNKIFCIKTEEIFYDIGTIENYELVNFNEQQKHKYRVKVKNILITGGAGFIGLNLVKKLIQNKNNKVFVVDALKYSSNIDAINKYKKN